jgi:hypothetical protein
MVMLQAATAGSEEAQMATRPDRSGHATRKQVDGLAVATLVFGIVGLILGGLSPPALLLGLVASSLGPGSWGEGASD